MYQNTITFQLATHYLPKIALRLESLCQTIKQACEESHPVIHYSALKNTIEIIKLIEKPELKSRFLKELMRIEHALTKSNTKISAKLYEELHAQIQTLTQTVGRFGGAIHHSSFLQSVRLSSAPQHAECEMYSPQLLLWLESGTELRKRDLNNWLDNLDTLYSTVALYLSLLRDTAQFNQIDMPNGFYQRSLPPKNICHLILLRIDKSFGVAPRMQLGHYGLSLRLCEISTMREVRETNAKLDLAICQL
ncbi:MULTISPECIES: cell division protein ZapD [unclassified Legionella]|uniref:cell division protein ZapD n=1 Tax=unclassified Legionella TaxID=2622702 RepID=UPI001054A481|nr:MULTISPECIES: cell division protein ZapD [unclassified Legionella]MDI9818809.1 cell division protein ZapD [Legionella sp. PL877]